VRNLQPRCTELRHVAPRYLGGDQTMKASFRSAMLVIRRRPGTYRTAGDTAGPLDQPLEMYLHLCVSRETTRPQIP
jgi:hypothetical protein